MRRLVTSRLIWVYTVCKDIRVGLQGLKGENKQTSLDKSAYSYMRTSQVKISSRAQSGQGVQYLWIRSVVPSDSIRACARHPSPLHYRKSD